MGWKTYLFIGKLLETAGALSLAYVGIKVAYIEWWLRGSIWEDDRINPKSGLGRMLKTLDGATATFRKKFGPTEALLVGIGTTLIAFGSLFYLYGIWCELDLAEH